MFLCPNTRYIVQALADDAVPGEKPHTFHLISCASCRRTHLADPETGELAVGIANCELTPHPKGVTPMPKPLREAINDAVVEYVTSRLQTGDPVDVAFMAREMSLPLIDMVMEQDEKHQGPLLAQIMGSLGNEYLERRGLLQNGRRDN
jgi:hypothetical protein